MAKTKTPKSKQRHRVRGKTCIFCGPTDAKITNEHIWPQWISELFYKKPKKNQYRVVRASAHTTGLAVMRRTFHSADLDSRVKVVCEPCNTTWMSDLENTHAKPLLSP